MPETASGEATLAPGVGDSTKTAGVTLAESLRSTSVAGTPSPPMPSTGAPSRWIVTRSTSSNCVAVKTTWATRSCIDRLPPPVWNAPERSTTAVPPETDTPRSLVASGIALVMPMSVSKASGPLSSASIAPSGVAGELERPAAPTFSFHAK